MLSVAKIRAGRAGYYLATVAAEDGAKGRGSLIEPDGYWLGSGAERLGLGGRAEAEAVRRILAGRHPYGGESLLDTRSRNRSVGAYDCTFSVPKSVSVLEALGAPEHAEAVRAAHATSVAGAVAYLESEAVRLRRSTADGRRSLPGDGVVAVAFPHSSSRAPDPHLHTHVLVANLVADGAGRWQCLDARRWYLELQAAAHLCEAGLRAELTTRLGVTWSEMRGSYADLRGISAEAVRAYSRRSVEIARLMSESRLTGPKASALLAAASRPRKDLTVSREELVGAWRERSWRLGISAGMLEDVAGRRPIGGAPEVPSSWQARTLEQVSTSSSGRSFDRRDLIRARCRTALDGRSAAGVLEDVDRLLASGLVARRAPVVTFMRTSAGMMPAGERDERYVTAQSLALESRLVEEMRALPADVSVIAYGPGQRMAALAGATCAPGASGLAPGLAAARSLEALTGVASVHSSELLEEASRRIVIADAHRLSSLQIERAVASARASSSEIALVVPEKELGRDALLAGVARSCRLEPVGEGAVEGAVGPIAEHAARKRPELDFGDVKAVVVSSLYEARQAVLERASARGAVVVTGDGAVASWLSHEASGDQKQPLAVRPGDQKQPLAVRPGEMEQRGVTVLTSRELRRL
ncbi:MAG: MobF family relaxase, partial [Acidimicrobiales bacterium]